MNCEKASVSLARLGRVLGNPKQTNPQTSTIVPCCWFRVMGPVMAVFSIRGARCFRLPPKVLHCHGVCEWHRPGTPPGASGRQVLVNQGGSLSTDF